MYIGLKWVNNNTVSFRVRLSAPFTGFMVHIFLFYPKKSNLHDFKSVKCFPYFIFPHHTLNPSPFLLSSVKMYDFPYSALKCWLTSPTLYGLFFGKSFHFDYNKYSQKLVKSTFNHFDLKTVLLPVTVLLC